MRCKAGKWKIELLPRRFWHVRPSEVELIEFNPKEVKLKQDHFITVFITFKGSKRKSLIGRITQNEVLQSWAVDCLASDGSQVAFRIFE